MFAYQTSVDTSADSKYNLHRVARAFGKHMPKATVTWLMTSGAAKKVQFDDVALSVQNKSMVGACNSRKLLKQAVQSTAWLAFLLVRSCVGRLGKDTQVSKRFIAADRC